MLVACNTRSAGDVSPECMSNLSHPNPSGKSTPGAAWRRLALATLLAASLTALRSPAQELLPREEAMRYALVAALHEPASTQAPIRVDADLKRPVAGYEGDYGALILPETKLTAASLAQVGTSPAPLAQLWLKQLTPMSQDSAVDRSRLELVSVRHEGETTKVPLCLLGVRKTSSGSLELVVYGKGKDPIATAPLKKVQRTQKLPIELSADRDSDRGRLTLKIVGEYEATLEVTELGEY